MMGWRDSLPSAQPRKDRKYGKGDAGSTSNPSGISGISVGATSPERAATRLEAIEQRATTREFDGGLPRIEAERLAMLDSVGPGGPMQ